MYTALDLKNDLLLNITSEFDHNSDVYRGIFESEFKFENTTFFTRKVWNTYQRYLRIHCPQNYKKILDEHCQRLLDIADKIHGERDNYYIMKIDIIATYTIQNSNICPEYIFINDIIKIDKYNDYIGEGGCGSVYKYLNETLGQYVAYKIFNPSHFHQSDIEFLKKRFVREGKKLISYRHPNIVAGYSIGNIGDTPYIKMEYIDGKPLLQFIKESNPDRLTRINLAKSLISATGYAHGRGDTHRDLSYSNIIVSTTGELKLLDFGFSKGDLDTSYDTTQCPVRTRFSPPEISSGSEYTFESEVYCIGAVIYSIFTGTEFNIQNINHINDTSIPTLYKDIILKCLEKEPKKRFSKASFINYYITKSNFTPQQNSHLIPEINDDFSLDIFQNKINERITSIQFAHNRYPTLESITSWVTNNIRDYVEENIYLSRGSFSDLLFKIDGAQKISWYKNSDKTISIKYISYIYNYFISTNDQQREFICKTLLSIIKRVSTEDAPYGFNDVPF